MKYVFITNRTDHNIDDPDIKVRSGRDAKLFVARYIDKSEEHSLDFETSGLDPYTSILLLTAINNHIDDYIIVIDNTSVDWVNLCHRLAGKLVIAQHAKFEYKFAKVNGIELRNLYCTMIAEQKLMQGATNGNDIISICKRRGVKVSEEWTKDIRNDFIGATKDIKFNNDHIKYVGFDVMPLKELRNIQRELTKMFNQTWFIENIHMSLIPILGDIELTGFIHNSSKWLEISKKSSKTVEIVKKRLNKYLEISGIDYLSLMPDYQKEKDKLVAALNRERDRLEKQDKKIKDLEEKEKTHTKAYQVLKESYHKTSVKFIELSQEHAEEIEPEPDINWESTKQVLSVLEALNIKPPLGKDQKTKKMKPSLAKEPRQEWLNNNKNHNWFRFMKNLDKVLKTVHNINSFGETWVTKYTNPVTGKVHTFLHQAGSSTGRFRSGDANSGYYNQQQIPAKKEYRECFGTEEGRSIATIDFVGCEVVCMISLSNDLELKRISELPDQHSYMGTKCWRAVYNHRYKKTKDVKYKELAENYVMTAKEHPKERRKFKDSGIFPVIYGVHNKKVAMVQGFNVGEGQIFIDVIESEMPNVVNFVKSQAEFAKTHGYVIHNKRTNSRRWFPKVLDSIRSGTDLEFMDRVNTESEARNTSIQGTNADLIQECMVAIDRWSRLYNLDIRCLGQIHDELVYDFPDEYVKRGIPNRIKDLMCKVAQRYLIPEISMKATIEVSKTWIK